MTNPASRFSDLDQYWARPFIERLARQGIVRGFPDGKFCPDQPMTRAEFAALLNAAFTMPVKRQYVPFGDVPENFWGAAAIRQAFEAGFVSGFPGNLFYPQRDIIRLHVVLALVASLNLKPNPAIALEQIYTDALQIPPYGMAAIQTATLAKLIVNYPDPRQFNPNRPATRAEVSACIHQALVYQARLLPIASPYIVQVVGQPPQSGVISSGTHLSVNGRKWKVPWGQQSSGVALQTGITDRGIMLVLGINLLDTNEPTPQPINWFSAVNPPDQLPSFFDGEYRYLNIDEFGIDQNWEIEIDSKTLKIASQIQSVQKIQWAAGQNQAQIRVELSQSTPWELYELGTTWEVVVDAVTSQGIVDQFANQVLDQAKPPAAPKPPGSNNSEDQNEGETSGGSVQPQPPVFKLETSQTVIQGTLPDGYRVRVTTWAQPPGLLIEVRQDALISRNIRWTKGLTWQQQYLNLGLGRFPVVWLKVLPQSGLILRPIWADQTQMKGITALLQMADTWNSLAAINGGYFNRNNLLPLGAICRGGTWFSGPILNRGAIAWNDTGAVQMGRLTRVETVATATGSRFEIDLLNTGYVKAGIARYTPAWGSSYTPLTLNEIAIAVESNTTSIVTDQAESHVVVRQIEPPDDKTPIPIPARGYLLILRSFRSVLGAFPVGTQVTLTAKTTPPEFNTFPHILGAGPLLLQDNKIVVDAEAEGFNPWFAQQAAIRSGIGVSARGELLIVTVHNRVGGTGATLREMAQLLQQLGAVHGLNLDGGSSTSLVLGGQLLNRPVDTAAPVQNGLGVFRG
ncbi:MAG: hypothetical protein HC835_03290 [Oscillatoriales cyanobacterium RM2_1_1]|nr:hypothetical protein [Oscillatoriales cyanobacterium SM2_3_0]NJO44718.1 hypothetical protein [Oscillatoriales cyanobacterium RM2_1_1]